MSRDPFFQSDGTVDVAELMVELERRVAQRAGHDGPTAEARARALRERMLGDSALGIRSDDCEVLPRRYTIDHHIPLLGPLHSVVRRLINAEVRRYLEAGLSRQGRLNRTFLRQLQELQRENEALRRELAALREQVERR